MSPYTVIWKEEDYDGIKETRIPFNSLIWAKACAFAIVQDNANNVVVEDCNGTVSHF